MLFIGQVVGQPPTTIRVLEADGTSKLQSWRNIGTAGGGVSAATGPGTLRGLGTFDWGSFVNSITTPAFNLATTILAPPTYQSTSAAGTTTIHAGSATNVGGAIGAATTATPLGNVNNTTLLLMGGGLLLVVMMMQQRGGGRYR